VGTHRRISAAPSNPCAANANGRTGRAGRDAAASSLEVRCVPATPAAGGYPRDLSLPAAVCGGARRTAEDTSPIDRPTDPSPRTVKGAMASDPLRRLVPRASRLGSPLPRRPLFRHRTSRPHRRPPCVQSGQVLASSLGVSYVSSQAAHPIEPPPAKVRRRCDGTLKRGANPPHHPATPPIATSRSALAKSNNSDMAAQTRSRPTTQGSTTPGPPPPNPTGLATNPDFETNENQQVAIKNCGKHTAQCVTTKQLSVARTTTAPISS
jgi:hypothetical protein